MFAARGYRAATIQEIAAELDISGAALYYYVSSKEDLLVEICWRAGNHLHGAVREVSALDAGPEEKLRELIRRHLEITVSDRAIFAILIQERSELPADRVEEMLEGERAYFATVRQLLEDVAGDVDPRLAALALIGMLNWVLRWYDESGTYRVEDVADGLFRIFWAGVKAPAVIDPETVK